MAQSRVFGCKCLMKMPPVNMGKLNHQSKAMIYLGTEHGTKAYLLFHPSRKRLYISRGVALEENYKPFNWDDFIDSMQEHTRNEWIEFQVHYAPTNNAMHQEHELYTCQKNEPETTRDDHDQLKVQTSQVSGP